jgi:redox-sensitive bicupin YhaK (pirin superfamily)
MTVSPAVPTLRTRTRGRTHGPVTRLVSPGDLGAVMKPFVFLDAFDTPAAKAPAFGIHPHSGLATLTYLIDGRFSYEDTTGKSGLLYEGGLEWMRAGGGVWHTGAPATDGRIRGYQLWVALPADWELRPAMSQYLAPEQVPTVGNVTVLLGTYEGAQSRIQTPAPMTYLSVTLGAGETWRYARPADFTVLWISVFEGSLQLPDGQEVSAGELAIFEGEGELPLQSAHGARFILGAAPLHPHPLVLGYYSVHTSEAALQAGESTIAQIGRELRAAGRL